MKTISQLESRMKEYESASKMYLTRRVPVIVRVDGRAFHTFCKGMNRPFDYTLTEVMERVGCYMLENMQGCVFGYRQSDEISFLLLDYKNLNSDAWFKYNIQKVASSAAALATMKFNYEFGRVLATAEAAQEAAHEGKVTPEFYMYYQAMSQKTGLAMFDARAFNIPESDVCNYFIWRQKDAIRNGILSVGRHYFGEAGIHNKSTAEIKNMLAEHEGIDYNIAFMPFDRHGMAFYKASVEVPANNENAKKETVSRRKVISDMNIPLFTEYREFVERWLDPDFELYL